MPTTILICGSPAEGFQIVGLFADSGDAQSYAEDHSLRDWWVAELHHRKRSPKASGDSLKHPSVRAGRDERRGRAAYRGNSGERKAHMRGIEKDDAEMSFRRGYQQGVRTSRG